MKTNKHLGIFLKIGDKLIDGNRSEYIIEDEEVCTTNHNKGHSDSDHIWVVKKLVDKSKFKTHKVQKMSDLFLQALIYKGDVILNKEKKDINGV